MARPDPLRVPRHHHVLVRACLRNRPGPYQVQAAINAVHTDAESLQSTDRPQILTLYDQLLALAPTPVVALNRAIVVGEVHGPQAALNLVDRLNLPDYHAFHATRADLLRRLGRIQHAAAAYGAASALAPRPCGTGLPRCAGRDPSAASVSRGKGGGPVSWRAHPRRHT
jgi:RNA polymerase sigma-70 factor (ECF subfamily)